MNDIAHNGHTYKKLDVVGEKVLVLKYKQWNDYQYYDGIYFRTNEKRVKNALMGCGKVLAVSPETSKKYGIFEGDIVVYDYWSSYGDYEDTIITNAENLLLKISEEEKSIFIGEEKV